LGGAVPQRGTATVYYQNWKNFTKLHKNAFALPGPAGGAIVLGREGEGRDGRGERVRRREGAKGGDRVAKGEG